jgi:hypothetical protein
MNVSPEKAKGPTTFDQSYSTILQLATTNSAIKTRDGVDVSDYTTSTKELEERLCRNNSEAGHVAQHVGSQFAANVRPILEKLLKHERDELEEWAMKCCLRPATPYGDEFFLTCRCCGKQASLLQQPFVTRTRIEVSGNTVSLLIDGMLSLMKVQVSLDGEQMAKGLKAS